MIDSPCETASLIRIILRSGCICYPDYSYRSYRHHETKLYKSNRYLLAKLPKFPCSKITVPKVLEDDFHMQSIIPYFACGRLRCKRIILNIVNALHRLVRVQPVKILPLFVLHYVVKADVCYHVLLNSLTPFLFYSRNQKDNEIIG